MNAPYFARLESLSIRLEVFCTQFDQGEPLDFSQIVAEVSELLEGLDVTKLDPKEKSLLEGISIKLTKLTESAASELALLREEMAGTLRRTKGLKAYTRQQYGE